MRSALARRSNPASSRAAAPRRRTHCRYRTISAASHPPASRPLWFESSRRAGVSDLGGGGKPTAEASAASASRRPWRGGGMLPKQRRDPAGVNHKSTRRITVAAGPSELRPAGGLRESPPSSFASKRRPGQSGGGRATRYDALASDPDSSQNGLLLGDNAERTGGCVAATEDAAHCVGTCSGIYRGATTPQFRLLRAPGPSSSSPDARPGRWVCEATSRSPQLAARLVTIRRCV